jgi:uncharacterized protein YjcR
MTANQGAKHHNAKMTTTTVRQARKSYEVVDKNGRRKWTVAALAEKYGVSPQTMHAIIKRTTWKHVS